MGTLFGTDGIRGRVDTEVTGELALDVGRALALACREGVLGAAAERPRVVVGRDTRVSGPMLEEALCAGLASGGAEALRAGIVPTPAVAYLTDALDAAAGIVLSASHNPPEDNGIKVFGPRGWKLDGATQDALEERLGRGPVDDPGSATDLPDAADRYAGHLRDVVGTDLDGLRVVADCGHGAACGIAPRVLRELGAEVTALHDAPDGERINVGCGATHPQVVAEVAREQGVVGLTFDGDADRVLAADEEGRFVDGDAILAVLARHLGLDAVVVTVMTNQAFRRWAAAQGIELVETPVGDRYVLAELRERGLVLGGEQSGHVIRLDAATTGDGLLTAVSLLDAVRTSGRRLADLVPFRPYPQVLVNVGTEGRERLEGAEGVWKAVRDAEDNLGEAGRVLVRPSGTEPLVRVMVEADDGTVASSTAESLADVIRRELNGA